MYRRGHELGSKRPGWSNPSAEWLRTAERRVAIESELPAFLAGEVKPRAGKEHIELANVCFFKKLYHASVRFFADAFAADPATADDPTQQNRQTAAEGAALAAAGRGEDVGGIGDEERTRLRAQALDWLRAALAFHAKRAAAGEWAVAANTLAQWQNDPYLADVRDPEALASIAAEERREFIQLWADVAALRRVDPSDVASDAGRVAAEQVTSGRRAEAESLYRKALKTQRRLHPGDHPDTARILDALGNLRLGLGPAAEAEAFLEEALDMQRRLHPTDHPDVATGLHDLARARGQLGRYAEAEALSREALEMRRRLFPGDHPDVAASWSGLGSALIGEDRSAEAEAALVEAMDMYRRLAPRDSPGLGTDLEDLGRRMESVGRLADAEALLAEALAMGKRLYPGDHPDLAKGLDDYAGVLKARGQVEEALDVCRFRRSRCADGCSGATIRSWPGPCSTWEGPSRRWPGPPRPSRLRRRRSRCTGG